MAANLPDVVRALLSMNYTVIPACAPVGDGSCTPHGRSHNEKDIGKVPLVSGYPAFADSPPGAAACAAFFELQYSVNAGIVVPAGMVVVDTDSPAADAEFSSLLPDGLVTPMRLPRPTRGRCWLFSVPQGCEAPSTTRRGASKAIDILGPGKFFIIPPSITASGYRHAWAPGAAPWEVPVAPLPGAVQAAVVAWTTKRERSPARRAMSPAVGLPIPVAAGADVEAGWRLVRGRSALRFLFEGRKGHGDQSESGIDFSFALAALRAGLRPAVVVALLGQRPGLHRSTTDYIERTVTSAQAALGVVR